MGGRCTQHVLSEPSPGRTRRTERQQPLPLRRVLKSRVQKNPDPGQDAPRRKVLGLCGCVCYCSPGQPRPSGLSDVPGLCAQELDCQMRDASSHPLPSPHSHEGVVGELLCQGGWHRGFPDAVLLLQEKHITLPWRFHKAPSQKKKKKNRHSGSCL